MKKENQLALLNRFPELYKDYYKPMTETCMCWGFDVGDGWFGLLWTLSLMIEDHLKRHPTDTVLVSQVKEKYGTLRFYFAGGRTEVEDMVSAAEDASANICEECGSWGEVYESYGWTFCRCPTCRAEQERRTCESSDTPETETEPG